MIFQYAAEETLNATYQPDSKVLELREADDHMVQDILWRSSGTLLVPAFQASGEGGDSEGPCSYTEVWQPKQFVSVLQEENRLLVHYLPDTLLSGFVL